MNNENKKSQETNHIICENEGNNENDNVDIEDIENKTHSNNEN